MSGKSPSLSRCVAIACSVWKAATAGVVLAVYSLWASHLCYVLEAGKEVVYTPRLQCTKYSGVVGAQGFTSLHSRLILASGDDRHRLWYQDGGGEGGLHLLHIKGSDLYPLVIPHKVTISGYPPGRAFRPDGVARWRNVLFVINHAYGSTGDVVEVFTIPDLDADLEPARGLAHFAVQHQYTITSPFFLRGSLSGIAAVDIDKVIVTYSRPFADSRWGRTTADELLNLASLITFQHATGVLTCDRTGCSQATERYFMAKGVAVDSSGIVWVNDFLAKQVSRYRVVPSNSTLQLVGRSAVPHALHNLVYDAELNAMLAPATPRIISSLEWNFGDDRGPTSPSALVTIDASTFDTRVGLVQCGSLLPGITAALRVPGTFSVLLGSWGADGVILCEVQALQKAVDEAIRRESAAEDERLS